MCFGNWWLWGVLLPSNQFRLIKIALTLLISYRMSIFRSFYDYKWPSQNFYQIHFGKIRGQGGGWVSTLRSLCILKSALELLITNPMSPLQNFTHLPLLYIPYMHTQGMTYNPYPEGCGGGDVNLPRHNFRTLQLRWTKCLSQNFNWMCLGKLWAREEGLVALQSLSTIEKGRGPFNL